MRAVGRSAGITAAILAAAALFASPAAMAASPAAKATIYNNIPSPAPGNVPSIWLRGQRGVRVWRRGVIRRRQPPESSGHRPDEQLGVPARVLEHGQLCHHQESEVQPVSQGDRLPRGRGRRSGLFLGSVTHTFGMPYRPAANYSKCAGPDAGKWYDKSSGTCYNGMAFAVKFVKLGSLSLPDDAIISVAFNTTHYGHNPVGEDTACFTSDGGCAYDALNVGTTGDDPSTVGTVSRDPTTPTSTQCSPATTATRRSVVARSAWTPAAGPAFSRPSRS